MDDFTIISYPGHRSDRLLSLTESRSRYMLPFGGKFRVVDFTLRNSFSSGARTTLIYNNFDDDLEEYVNRYGPFTDVKFPPIKVISRAFSDINVCYNLIMESNTNYYIIYNGDNPSIIDFTHLIKKYKKKKTGAVLFRLKINGKPSMAYTVLISNQRSLLKVINSAIKEKRDAPNLFEMIINIMINGKIVKDTFEARYWPIKHIPEYNSLNRDVIWDSEISDMLYNEKIIKSQLVSGGFAHIGVKGKIVNSFVSDFCKINGTVENSIIYPGVEIGEDSLVRDSIILPYVHIGKHSRIIRSIIDESKPVIDESTPDGKEVRYLNIGNDCKIGSREEFIKNKDFPQSLFSSITMIGKDCHIADGARIGGGCYVASGKGNQFFSERKVLYDGVSILK